MRSGVMISIQGVSHSFGSRSEHVALEFQPYWDRSPVKRQVHGSAVAEITMPGQQCGEVDAVFTRKPGIPISVITADCVPILLARKDGKACAAIHAGWRGTRAEIIKTTWQAIDEDPAEWVAAIGPCIGPCCYEVSEELIRDFQSHFLGIPKSVISPRPRILDLRAINSAQLSALGITEIDVLPYCTKCARNEQGLSLFHSYRRDKVAHRQYSIIMIR